MSPQPQKQSKPKPVSYLDRISFDKKLWNGPIAKYVVNIRIVVLLIISILSIGIFSYLQLPKRLNPEIKIPIVTVVTVLPGASPEDVESLVTIPIENKLRSIKGIDQLTSSSMDNMSVITIQFLSSVAQDKAKADVQSEIDSITDLPEDAKTPTVKALDFEDTPIWTFAVSTKKDLRSLMIFSDILKEKITDLSKVDRVILTGFENQEITVEISPSKLKEYGINPLVLSQLISTGIASYPAGTVDTGKNSFSLTIDPQVTNVEEIRNIRLNVGGKSVLLSDIAKVSNRTSLDHNNSYIATNTQNQQRVVTFYVYKTQGVNIDEAANSVSQIIDSTNKSYNNEFKITTISNNAQDIEDQFSDLLKEFRTTILLIVGCLFIFLGLRQAIIASFTVPLTFLSGFFFMERFGQSINFLTLFAILLALGLLIDDTIVVVQAMTTYYKTGKFTPAETGLVVWRDTIVPIWSTTITTIWSFVPLLVTSGIIGEFIKPIPIVVTVIMISSTAIAVLITLPLMIVLLKPRLAHRVAVLIQIVVYFATLMALIALIKGNVFFLFIVVLYTAIYFLFFRFQKVLFTLLKQGGEKNKTLSKIATTLNRYSSHGVISIEPLANAYHNLILRILNSPSAINKTIFAIVLYSIVAFALLPLGLVKSEFFPKTDSELFYVGVLYPSGTNLEYTNRESLLILDKLRHVKDSVFVTAEIGQQVGGSFMGSRISSSNSSVFTVHLLPEEKRKRKSMEIAQGVRDMLSNYTKGTVSVIEESGGPPAGADLQIKYLGDDLGELDTYANRTMKYLQKKQGVANVDKTIKAGTSKLVFVPDMNKLTENGIALNTLGLWLRLYASGFTLDSVNFDKTKTEKTDVVFRMASNYQSPETITSLSIPTATGTYVPLSALGEFTSKPSPSLITRENGKRTVSVTAAVLPGTSTTEANKDLTEFVNKNIKLKEGYVWKTGGVNEENQKSTNSILQAMIISAVLILVTMVLQFQSYRQAVIVLIVIPLAVSSVFVAFALLGIPLSFPALIGVLSLFGIVVTNSMFIVDKININLKEGMEFKEAIADAGASRLEPIILTKLNTILGLLPITIANPLWRGLGGAIISGLLLASSIMLLFIPALYYLWFKGDENKNHKS